MSVYVFVDASLHGGQATYSIVVVRVDRLRELGRKLRWVKHRRKLGRREKRGYDLAFLRRFERLLSSGLVEEAAVVYSLGELAALLQQLKSRYRVTAAYIDDQALEKLRQSRAETLGEINARPESETARRKGDLRRVMLLADNLASLAAAGKLGTRRK